MINRRSLLAFLAFCIPHFVLAEPLGTGFAYQGRLEQDAAVVNDSCDFRFELFNAGTEGGQIGPSIDALNVPVNDGAFSVVLDFGPGVFDGTARWLEIAVVCPADSGALTPLTPRQQITATPYALYAANVPPLALDDIDRDGVANAEDNCPFTPNPGRDDGDSDGIGDACDNCPDVFNPWNIDTDGNGTGDDCEPDLICNPVAQTGCGPGDKCTFVPDEVNPDDLHSYCRPNGSVQWGGNCSVEPGTGLDNCAAGLFCIGGVCQEICSVAPDSCPDGFSCSPLTGLVDSPNTGYCQVTCDPLSDPTGCQEGEACYVNMFVEANLCATPAASSTQGEACEYINACASGYSCLLNNSPTNPTGLDCAFICDALGGGGPTCAEGSEPTYTCVQINQFYSNLDNLPDAYGMCVDPVEWDEDGDGVLDYADQCPETPPATPVDAVGCPL